MAGPTMRDFYWGFLSTWIPQDEQDGPPARVELAEELMAKCAKCSCYLTDNEKDYCGGFCAECEFYAAAGVQTVTCEKCGHECGADCTNCSGMKVGESICSICSRGQS